MLRKILAYPEDKDIEQRYRGKVLNTIIISMFVIILLAGLIGVPFIFAEKILSAASIIFFLVSFIIAKIFYIKENLTALLLLLSVPFILLSVIL